MQVLTDAQWAKFEAAIAAANIRGARPRTEDRRTQGSPLGTNSQSSSSCLAPQHRADRASAEQGSGRVVHPPLRLGGKDQRLYVERNKPAQVADREADPQQRQRPHDTLRSANVGVDGRYRVRGADEQPRAVMAAERQVGQRRARQHLPGNVPAAAMQCTPSAALLQTRPSSSQRRPSQKPGEILWNTRPFASRAPSSTSNTRMCCTDAVSECRPSAAYSSLSSGDK